MIKQIILVLFLIEIYFIMIYHQQIKFQSYIQLINLLLHMVLLIKLLSFFLYFQLIILYKLNNKIYDLKLYSYVFHFSLQIFHILYIQFLLKDFFSNYIFYVLMTLMITLILLFKVFFI